MQPNPVHAYIGAVVERLNADGCQPHPENWNGATVMVGRRSDFKLAWMATRMHLFTMVVAVPEITVPAIMQFTEHATGFAKNSKGGLPRGLQTGIALFPAMVSDRVDPAAVAWAEEKQRLSFACFTRPVVVDVTYGVVGCFRRNATVGAIYNRYLRAKGDLYFPRWNPPTR